MTNPDEQHATTTAAAASGSVGASGTSRDVGARTGTAAVKAPQPQDTLAGAPPRQNRPAALRNTNLHPDAVAAIMAADHGDPFSILGPHQVGEGRWEVRAVLPEAQGATLIVEGKRIPFEKVHDDGFFVASVESAGRPLYEIAVAFWDGSERTRHDPYGFGSSLEQHDLHALREVGSNVTYRILGAQKGVLDGIEGFRFAVWAPNARKVSVVGDFNDWDGRRHPMRLWQDGGVWELFVPGLKPGQNYKFELRGPDGSLLPLKADPVAFRAQHPPQTASVLQGTSDPEWHDKAWMETRGAKDPRHVPMSVYEVHLGSWMRVPEEGNRYLTYKELGERLIPYVKELGFTHIELLPITEFPFDGSWGYQPVSLFAPTSRHGSPDDFAAFVNAAHEAGIGILLDWVPGHFPLDAHGLGLFDGTHLYEHADPRQGFHQDWGTYIYNFGRTEVSAFLTANARGDQVGVVTQAAGLADQLGQVLAHQRFTAGEADLRGAHLPRFGHYLEPLLGTQLLALGGEVQRVRAVRALQRAAVGEFGQQPQRQADFRRGRQLRRGRSSVRHGPPP